MEVLRNYEGAMAGGVARMWTVSRECWPSGFFGAGEITARSVEMDERAYPALLTRVALLGDTVAGYCKTTPYASDLEACYVALVNVIPECQGRGLGRRLLEDAVRFAGSLGYKRIDLHTWPANLNAVPLYKKLGFFWVPDTMVYMQNYMPFILGTRELGVTEWYGRLDRRTDVAPDGEKTVSGRDVFTYSLPDHRGRPLSLSFDMKGRILSSITTPRGTWALEREEGEPLTGKPFRVTVTAPEPGELPVEKDPGVSAPETAGESFQAVLNPVRVPAHATEKAPRVGVRISESISLGMGLPGREPIRLVSHPVLRVRPGCESVPLTVERAPEASSVQVSGTLDGKPLPPWDMTLEDPVVQRVMIPVSGVGPGPHLLELVFRGGGGFGGAEKILLLADTPSIPEPVELREKVAVAGGDTVCLVYLRSCMGAILAPDEDGGFRGIGSFSVRPGPWSNTLSDHIYRYDGCHGGEARFSADWPGRPGVRAFLSLGVTGEGALRARASAGNDTSEPFPVSFVARAGLSGRFGQDRLTLPLPEGVMSVTAVGNQVPDYESDFPGGAGELGAPWRAVFSGDRGLLMDHRGWEVLSPSGVATEDAMVAPGEILESPPLTLVVSPGGLEALAARARSSGLAVEEKPRVGFIDTNLLPLMARGSALSLSHRLWGNRSGRILLDGSQAASGKVSRESAISAVLPGDGPVAAGLELAGRTLTRKVFQVEAPPVETGEGEDLLFMANGRARAEVRPSCGGHVYSMAVDGEEFLMSAGPEPGRFQWENPWFGGIAPGLLKPGMNQPLPLHRMTPRVFGASRDFGGIPTRGFTLEWKVDHREYGSLSLLWTVTMFPGVPVLMAEFESRSETSGFLGAPMGIRCFPVISRKSVLRCGSVPGLVQGRNHSGAWFHGGKWMELGGGKGRFVLFRNFGRGHALAEDYGKPGCPLTLGDTARGPVLLRCVFVFGSGKDRSLRRVLKEWNDLP